MTSAGTFPFDPEKVAALAALSRALVAQGAPPPMSTVVVDEQGYAWLPHPGGNGDLIRSFVHAGVRIGWAPVPELGGMLLSQWGGPGPDADFEEDGLTTFLTRDGLRAIIGDLQAIEAALGDG